MTRRRTASNAWRRRRRVAPADRSDRRSAPSAETTSDKLGATEPHNLTGAWQPPPPAHIVLPGVVLDGRYRLEQMLGRGATAEVFRGTDDLLKRSVAIKVFHQGISDTTSAARQRTEMQVLAKLHHPHLVMVYDAKIGATTNDPNTPVSGPEALSYLVMELVQGGTLADRIKPGGLPPAEVAGIGAAVAGALAAVHRLGMVHRDIKPANILMSTTGEAKLSDFGIARDLEAEHLTAAADVIGTAAYLSPEQARGADVGPPTDIYALGLVLLECLTGRREFPGKAVESAMARLLRDPVIPADLPMPWPPLLRAMTQSDPRLRPTASRGRDGAASTSRQRGAAARTLRDGHPAQRLSGSAGDGHGPAARAGQAAQQHRPGVPHRVADDRAGRLRGGGGDRPGQAGHHGRSDGPCGHHQQPAPDVQQRAAQNRDHHGHPDQHQDDTEHHHLEQHPDHLVAAHHDPDHLERADDPDDAQYCTHQCRRPGRAPSRRPPRRPEPARAAEVRPPTACPVDGCRRRATRAS